MKTVDLLDRGGGFAPPRPVMQSPIADCTASLPRRVLEFGIARNARVVAARMRSTLARISHRVTGWQAGQESPAYGVALTHNFRDKTYRYCRYGTYGRRLADYLAHQDTPFGFVDVGANQGLFSLLAARNPACRAITAFEPVPKTFSYLRANIALNGADRFIRPVNAAIGARSGICDIAVKPGHSGVASLARCEMFEHGATQQISLMDGVSAAGEMPQHLPLIVKIDVEGHEQIVIEQLLASPAAPRIVAIFYEMDERWADADAVRATLERAGFERFTRYGIGRHGDILAERSRDAH